MREKENNAQNMRWVVVSDNSGTYAAFPTKAEADQYADQFCPIGSDGERDMNVAIWPEGHILIGALGLVEREVK